jgi:hypothetical protein
VGDYKYIGIHDLIGKLEREGNIDIGVQNCLLGCTAV